jgi:hypothetical protein
MKASAIESLDYGMKQHKIVEQRSELLDERK